MELDSLKAIWKESTFLPTATTQLELEQMLSKKSQSPIAKIKRNLFWELMVVVILYTSTIIYYFIENSGMSIASAWMLIVMGLLYLLYYVQKKKLLKKMECITCEVKSNLSTQLSTLEKYIKIYLWAGTLLVPLIMIFFFIIGYIYLPDVEKLKMQKTPYSTPAYVIVSIVFSAILTLPIYFLNKWYVHKLYGQHVKKLRIILNEMNEIPFQ